MLELLIAKQKKNSSTQLLITTPSSRKSDFNKDLCKALLKSNIPLEKLSNTHFLCEKKSLFIMIKAYVCLTIIL